MTIAPPIRRLVLETILSLTLLLLWLTYTGRVHIFLGSKSSADNATAAYYLLSTDLQVLGSVFAITIAVLFLAAQIYTRPQYARAVTEVYRDQVTWLVLSVFMLSIVAGTVTLARVNYIIRRNLFFLFDWNICFALTSMCLLLVLTASQVANIDPYLLATRLVRRITMRRVVEYNLSEVHYDKPTRKLSYRLHVYGYQHGREDPLAPFHEIVLLSVQNRDRVAMSSLIRLLLARIADVFGTPYSLTPSGSVKRWRAHELVIAAELLIRRPIKCDDAIRMALFIMTYVVRRSQRLRDEWDGLDIVRQQYILNIRDLIVTLARRNGTDDAIRICLFAVMHICLAYSKIARYGEDEALRHYYVLAADLVSRSRSDVANLCVQVLAVLKQRTTQIPPSLLTLVEASMHPQLIATYEEAGAQLKKNLDWLPGTSDSDPWRYRVSAYPLEAEPHRIVLA